MNELLGDLIVDLIEKREEYENIQSDPSYELRTFLNSQKRYHEAIAKLNEYGLNLKRKDNE